jgi:membrane associated rhomboid family serine protease
VSDETDTRTNRDGEVQLFEQATFADAMRDAARLKQCRHDSDLTGLLLSLQANNPSSDRQDVFPIRDENPRVHPPVATIVIIGLNVLAWTLLQGFGTGPALAKSICLYGLVPGDLLHTMASGSQLALDHDIVCVFDGQSNWTTIVSSMFMHGGWLHLVGNMWFLWIFGDNVEDAMGHVRFVVFYLLCGTAAATAQMFADTSSIVPMVGASGAIGGVMGAYALLYPRAHVHMFVFLGFYMTTVAVPAIYMLGYWFLLQLLSGLPRLTGEQLGGVAFWAHVGGFVAGLVLVMAFRQRDRLDAHRNQVPRQTARNRWL